jgi:transcription elongation factor GreA
LGSLVVIYSLQQNKKIMSDFAYYTEEGLKKLKDEVHEMKTVQRPRISEQIAEARDKGDLSENAEYDAAKEAQGLLEMKIAKMDALLAKARIIDNSLMDNSKVFILSRVKIKNVNNDMEMEYTLVAESEADLKLKKISIDSPIGKGLLGKKVGDIADVQTPNGIIKFEVIDIAR